MNKLLKAALTTAAVGAGLYAYAQAPRKNHPGLEHLKKFRYAHRGLHDLNNGVPENTLPAFRAAVNHGFGAELDVHITKDDQLVVIHDSKLERLCGVEGVVEDMTYDELKALYILGTENYAPLFSEVLAVFDGKTPLIVELKTYNNNAERLCPAVDAMLKAYNGAYCVESFDPKVVQWYKEHSPEVVRGQLSMDYLHSTNKNRPLWQRAAMTHLLTNCMTRPDFVAYRYDDRDRLPSRIACSLLGAQEVSWTIRTMEDLLRAEKNGAMVIFENFLP